jgi:hypothetical protein
MADAPWKIQYSGMKNTNSSQEQRYGSRPTASAKLTRDQINFAPSPDEVARRAYFTYENEGSQPGRDVQHWLAAEAQLLAERNETRAHGYHNQT